MVKFGGKIGTLYQIFTIDLRVILSIIVATGVNALLLGLLNNVQKNCTFLKGWLPLGESLKNGLFTVSLTVGVLRDHFEIRETTFFFSNSPQQGTRKKDGIGTRKRLLGCIIQQHSV